MRRFLFYCYVAFLIFNVLVIMMIYLDIRYGNVTECDKLIDKPIGFVHMDDQKVMFTASTFVGPFFSQPRSPLLVFTMGTIHFIFTSQNLIIVSECRTSCEED